MTSTRRRPPAPGAAQPQPPVPGPDPRFPWHADHLAPPAAPTAQEPAHGRPAGVVTRAVARVVDVCLVTLALALGYAAWAGFRFLLAPESFRLLGLPFFWIIVAVELGLVVYWTVAWAGPARTHGDQFMGLRVAGPDGARLGPVRAAARAVLCVLFLPGLFWVAVSSRNRSVQDILLRTAVLYD